MDKIKMTIHRALAELKLIDSKIEKAIIVVDPIAIMQKDKLVNGSITQEDFISNAKAKYQSVNDLFDRKVKIKSAIIKANSGTTVKIGDNEMTIADAINFKTLIEFKKKLITTLAARDRKVKATLMTDNEKINELALNNAKIMLGKQTDNTVLPTDADVKAITDPFIERNQWTLVDPLNLETTLEVLNAEVDEFETEVDAVLSEINAITIIEI